MNYADVNATRIDKLVVSLLDNYGNPIDMNTSNGKYPPEAFSVLLCITEKNESENNKILHIIINIWFVIHIVIQDYNKVVV